MSLVENDEMLSHDEPFFHEVWDKESFYGKDFWISQLVPYLWMRLARGTMLVK